MTFLGAPLGALAGLFGVAGATLTVLYLLKLHRRRVVVPFARLWLSVVGAREAESLWRRLRRIYSLLLQLLVLALVVLALADPRPARGEAGRTIALVIDASASMRATDAEPFATRFDRARHEARALIAGLGRADLALVIRLDGRPLALGGLESDERELERQIDSLEASDTPADVERGLRLAADVLRGHPRPTLLLVTDGAWPKNAIDRIALRGPAPVTASAPATASPRAEVPSELGLDAIDLRGIDVRHVPVGKTGDNVGIVAFSVRRYPQNKSAYEVMVEVQSFRDVASTVKLELLQDGEVVDVEKLDLGAGERAQRFLPNLTGAGTRLEARLVPAEDAPPTAPPARLDAFPLDDRAYAVLSPRHKQKVLLVSDGNLFLEGALLLNENIELEKIPTSEWDAARASRYDVVVLDGYTPPAPPAAATFYIDPRGDQSPFAIAGEAKSILVTDVAEKHPVMRWVTLRDLNVSRTSYFKLKPGDVALASSLRDPVLVAREGAHRSVALGFDVRRSDLPLRVSFPVLLVNAFDWFAADDATLVAAHKTGQSFTLPSKVPTAGAGQAVSIREPDGRSSRMTVVDGRVRHYAERAGFYEVSSLYEGMRTVAANLADGQESAIRPALPLVLDGQALGAPEGFRRGMRRELWAYLVLAALALSLVEWWTYHRRVTV